MFKDNQVSTKKYEIHKRNIGHKIRRKTIILSFNINGTIWLSQNVIASEYTTII